MTKKIILFVAATFSLTLWAASKPTLKSVMQGLENSMSILNHGLFVENFKEIAVGAGGIAEHPKPKSQMPIIAKTLGARMAKFKGYDMKVHDAAQDIIKLANKKDLAGIMVKHKVIMDNCVACHSEFRAEIAKVLPRAKSKK